MNFGFCHIVYLDWRFVLHTASQRAPLMCPFSVISKRNWNIYIWSKPQWGKRHARVLCSVNCHGHSHTKVIVIHMACLSWTLQMSLLSCLPICQSSALIMSQNQRVAKMPLSPQIYHAWTAAVRIIAELAISCKIIATHSRETGHKCMAKKILFCKNAYFFTFFFNLYYIEFNNRQIKMPALLCCLLLCLLEKCTSFLCICFRLAASDKVNKSMQLK